ncbi:transglutaminase family protein [Cellulomonas composti]|uniref:Transglutaminase-like domain-containing protein n=1 Tax=Cellulomonas composti TaxID=266130 RepID=A0A511JER1_9CELL|nr:transglutaminase family protein [Cellulomonas composti]GEL96416.1 hypothetical protein CCO02nite_30740 [Cellulomonas composti]
MSRAYDLVHRTTYEYDEPVTDSYGRATLTPRHAPGQHVDEVELVVEPTPGDLASHTDWYGNTSTYFGVTTEHSRLVVTARSRVTVSREAPDPTTLPRRAWDDVAAALAAGDGQALGADPDAMVALHEAVLPSLHVTFAGEVREWAAPSFRPGRPLGELVVDLASRIHDELEYRTGSTTVHTTQVQLLAQRAGVCQDFAHLMLAALRLHGVPARYVSGYLETRPAPGRAKLRGADASHAWVSVWLPGLGWVDVDPTNDQLVDERYVVLGWGRDYHDVPPLRGVIFSEGSGARPHVQVDMVPVGAPRFE